MEIERKKLPKESLDQQKRICEVRCVEPVLQRRRPHSPPLHIKCLVRNFIGLGEEGKMEFISLKRYSISPFCSSDHQFSYFKR